MVALPRYLAAARKLNLEARGKTLYLSPGPWQSQRLPGAGHDAIADQRRAVRAILLDAVSAGLDLVPHAEVVWVPARHHFRLGEPPSGRSLHISPNML